MQKLMISDIAIDSREIAELTGKLHKHVVRDIENMLTGLGGTTNFGHTYTHPQNKQNYRCFVLPKRETLILVSGYSVELRARIIDRLEVLENRNKPQLPQSFSEALLLASQQAKQLEEQAPKVELADKALRNDKEMSITDAGKHLGIRQKDIFIIMRDNQYLTVRNLPTQKALDRKVLTLKTNAEEGFRQSVMNMSNIIEFQKRHLQKEF